MTIVKDLLNFAFYILFLLVFSQFLGCSTTRQTYSETNQIENKSDNSTPKNVCNVNLDNSNIAIAENFAKDWKNKLESSITELQLNHHLWQENEIKNYDFVAAKYAGGNTNEWNRSPVLIKVRDGEKSSIEVKSKFDNSYMAKTDGFEEFDTIDKLFNYLRQRLNDGNIIDTKYDKKFGYPKSVFITFAYNSDHNYQTIQISKFEIVK